MCSIVALPSHTARTNGWFMRCLGDRAISCLSRRTNSAERDRSPIYLSTRRLDRLVCDRNRDRAPILRAEVSCDVALSGRIFDQVDVAWTDGDLLTSRNLDFPATAERDHKLAPRTGMPLVCAARRPAAELHACGLDHLGRVAGELHFNVFGVAQA